MQGQTYLSAFASGDMSTTDQRNSYYLMICDKCVFVHNVSYARYLEQTLEMPVIMLNLSQSNFKCLFNGDRLDKVYIFNVNRRHSRY